MNDTSDQSEKGIQHEHEAGDILEKFDSSEWKITNRMVDVDTGEVLYRLREQHPRFNDTEIATDSQIDRNFEEVA